MPLSRERFCWEQGFPSGKASPGGGVRPGPRSFKENRVPSREAASGTVAIMPLLPDVYGDGLLDGDPDSDPEA